MLFLQSGGVVVCFREKGRGVCPADAGVAILQSYAFLLVRFGGGALLCLAESGGGSGGGCCRELE